MKKCFVSILSIVILLLFVLNTGCGGPDIEKARQRVDVVLKGISMEGERGPDPKDEETAISYFWAGKPRIMDFDDLNNASNAFDQWRREKDISAYITEYTIEGAVIEGDDVIVFVTIEGKPMSMRVPEKKQITWSDHKWEDVKK